MLNIQDIAKEALCAVLARKLHLPVPQPYYVSIDSTVARQPVGNHYNIAFGLQDELLPFQRINDPVTLSQELVSWPELNRCAVFDAWVANRDRLPHNLLFAGNHDFWMIDHEEALPGYLSSSSPINAQLFEIIRKDKSEHELYQLREQLQAIADTYKQIDWDEIKKLVRLTELQESEKFFGGYISQLRERAINMRAILTAELGIKQQSIEFISGENESSEVTKK